MTYKTKNMLHRINRQLNSINTEAALEQTNKDFKNAVLIVSVGINLFLFTAWLALQVTAHYDTQVAVVLFG